MFSQSNISLFLRFFVSKQSQSSEQITTLGNYSIKNNQEIVLHGAVLLECELSDR